MLSQRREIPSLEAEPDFSSHPEVYPVYSESISPLKKLVQEKNKGSDFESAVDPDIKTRKILFYKQLLHRVETNRKTKS
jgi:hypothetical protein